MLSTVASYLNAEGLDDVSNIVIELTTKLSLNLQIHYDLVEFNEIELVYMTNTIN